MDAVQGRDHHVTYLTGMRRTTLIRRTSGMHYLIVKKSNYNVNRLKLQPKF